MLAVARALIVRPRLLMLDEPSAGLSPKMVEPVFAKLKAIRASGVTILLVEQNVRAALAIADRAYVLVEGENRHEGNAADVAGDPVVAELYLGGAHGPRQRPVNLQFLADGLLIGAMIGLGAIGVTLTYSILRFANFAHGEFIAWGAYARWRSPGSSASPPGSRWRRSGRSPSAGRWSPPDSPPWPDRPARARARCRALQPAAGARQRHRHGHGELRRLDGAAQPARIHLHLAAGLFHPRHPDRDAARRRACGSRPTSS